MKTDEVIQCPHRPTPIHQVETVHNMIPMIQELGNPRTWEMGVFEKCDRQYRSPLLLVDKKDKNSKRLVVDYRSINALSQDILYPMPDLESTRALCGSADLYSVFDLKSAFWQIPLEESSRDCTAIWVTGMGCYRFKVCPQDHKQSPGALQHLSDLIFSDIRGNFPDFIWG